MRRFFPSTIRVADDNPFPYLANNSLDSFGFIKLYDTAQDNSIELRRPSDNAVKDIPWDGNKIDKAEILNFGDLLDTDDVKTLYGQKNPSIDLAINARGLGNNLVIGTGFDFYQNAPNASRHYRIQGTLANSIIKNREYIAATFLFKANTTSGSILFISASGGITRLWILINIIDGGYTIGGRRVNGDAFQGISSSGIDPTLWHVITAIWDYAGRKLILRVDGVQEAILETFHTGANTENVDPTSLVFLGGRDANNFGVFGSFAHATFWNTPTTLTEIQDVENLYLDIKDLLP